MTTDPKELAARRRLARQQESLRSARAAGRWSGQPLCGLLSREDRIRFLDTLRHDAHFRKSVLEILTGP